MLDMIGWFLTNVALAFYNFAYAVTHPGLWLDWSNPEAIARTIYYGASVELFFVVFNIALIVTLVGLWRTSVLWACVRGLEGLANTVGRTAAWAGLLMVLVQVMIVFMQRIFAVSSIGIGFGGVISFDVSWWSEGLKLTNALVVALCLSYTFVQRGHVRVDILYAGFSFRRKRIVDMAGAIFFMAPMAILIWLYGWFFMWRHLVVPAPSASDALDRILMRARVLRWNVETTGFSPQGFSAYFLFKVLLVAMAGMILLQALAVIWRATAELREGPQSEDKYLDRDDTGTSESAEHVFETH